LRAGVSPGGHLPAPTDGRGTGALGRAQQHLLDPADRGRLGDQQEGRGERSDHLPDLHERGLSGVPMSAFEFFFSFYGLVLSFSVVVLSIGAARAFKHRKTVRLVWLTPLLAVFVALDIVTFWDAAWVNFRGLPFSYGLLVGGM